MVLTWLARLFVVIDVLVLAEWGYRHFRPKQGETSDVAHHRDGIRLLLLAICSIAALASEWRNEQTINELEAKSRDPELSLVDWAVFPDADGRTGHVQLRFDSDKNRGLGQLELTVEVNSLMDTRIVAMKTLTTGIANPARIAADGRSATISTSPMQPRVALDIQLTPPTPASVTISGTDIPKPIVATWERLTTRPPQPPPP